jgi:membrane-associated phospholipid phosphatase/diacylglycerol kinase family enzyme
MRRPRRWAHRFRRLDLALFERTAAQKTPHLDPVIPRISRSANHGLLWLAAAGVLAAFGGPRGRAAAIRALAALTIASTVVNLPVKFGARRHRPPIDRVPVVRRLPRTPTTFSFPSGHSASAAAFATGAAIELPRAAVPLGLLAGTVAYSRVYAGVHYPSDVAVGVAAGVAAAAVTLRPWPRSPDVGAEPGRTVRVSARADGDGVIIVLNRASGDDDADERAMQLREALPSADVVDVAPDDLRDALEDAASRARVLGIAGGDGSIGAAADLALDADIPLLVVPTGTRNHFALDLGLHTTADAVKAFMTNTAVRADIARAADTTFVNTLAAGAYPRLVDKREQLAPKLTEWPATLVGVVDSLRHGDPLRLAIDSEEREVWMLWVGNCVYEPGGFVRGRRPRLDDGLFDVRVVYAEPKAARSRLVGSMLTGTLESSEEFARWTAESIEIVSQDGPLRLARDGDTLDAPAAVEIRKATGSVRVFATA